MVKKDLKSKINDKDNQIPDNCILVITENDEYSQSTKLILDSLKNVKRRDWFVSHAYLCLPLVIGNQYGFIIKTLFDIYAEWNGGENASDVKVNIINNLTEEQRALEGHQIISSHFGMGTFTIQNRFHFRTPPGINLMTINPPNFYIDGLQHMTGIIETDNLRRDFTFNLKLTCPGKMVHIKAGTPVGCILPIQRYFVDKFKTIPAEDIFSNELIEQEREIGREFGEERQKDDLNKKRHAGRRYFEGEDVRGNKFKDHQKRVD